MAKKTPSPGVSRQARLSDEGLQRLEKQLVAGVKVTPVVLAQWIRRYGEPAREMIKLHGQYSDVLATLKARLD